MFDNSIDINTIQMENYTIQMENYRMQIENYTNPMNVYTIQKDRILQCLVCHI